MYKTGYHHITVTDASQINHAEHKVAHSVSELKIECDNEELTTFEILKQPIRRMYLHIKHIPKDDFGIFYDIVERWCEFAEIDDNQYFFTKNEGSKKGYNYHLFFPLKTTRLNLLRGVKVFKSKYPEFAPYISDNVYDINKVFRLPEQPGVEFYIPNYNPEEDKHHIVRGNFEDCVVQNVDNIPLYTRDLSSTSFSSKDYNLNIGEEIAISTEQQYNILSDALDDIYRLVNSNIRASIETNNIMTNISNSLTENKNINNDTRVNIEKALNVLYQNSMKHNNTDSSIMCIRSIKDIIIFVIVLVFVFVIVLDKDDLLFIKK